jgi:2-desacetyl-2-hydroxyethyl bacteriochlorophyllide A dehydrogenase
MAVPLARQLYFKAPYEVAVRDVELAPPGPGEVLLTTTISGISHGTEMNVYRGRAPQWRFQHDQERRLFVRGETGAWSYPLAYGYASVGVVKEIGEGVPYSLLGTRAFCYKPHQSCHVLRPEDLVPIGDLPDEKAVFVATGTTAFNGVLDATLHYGDVAVVFGQGVIGQIVGRLCKASGCTVVVVDRLAGRLQQASAWGADVVINPDETEDVALAIRDLTQRRGADTVFDVTGNPRALHEAIRTAAPNCEVVAMSWYATPAGELELGGEFHHNRIRIRSSQVGQINPLLTTWSNERRHQVLLTILQRFDVERMVGARFTLDQAAEAYAAIDRSTEPPLQAVFVYT